MTFTPIVYASFLLSLSSE